MVVTKVTDPVDNVTAFSLHAEGTGTITAPANRTIQSGTPQDFEVTPGTYRVGELAQAGWDQTGNTCHGLVVAAGATVPCTITNTKKGSIAHRQEHFGWRHDLQLHGRRPQLLLGGTERDDERRDGRHDTDSDMSAGTYYSGSETVPAGWDQTASSCNNGTPGCFVVPAGGTVTCMFTNTKKGHVVVTKVTDPAGDPTSSRSMPDRHRPITAPANRTIVADDE